MEKNHDGNFGYKKSFRSFVAIMDVRTRILDKAHELFTTIGVRSVSMDDISAQLGMSKKTVYHYFADKEELVDAVVGSLLSTSQSKCITDKNLAENAIHEVFLAFEMIDDIFSNMNPSIVFDLQKYHPSIHKKVEQHKKVFLYDVVRENLERGIAEELYRPDINVDILSRFRIESVMLVFNSDIFPNNRTQFVNIHQEILENFLFGLATAKGQELIQNYKELRNKK
jgi:TetR/AcrR family transcriptional regulator, cholesterol catabolism regulator